MADSTAQVSEVKQVDEKQPDSPRIRVLEDATEAENQFDIVLVHGIHGHPLTSWADPNTQRVTTWFNEYLRESLPAARVLSFGYDMEDRARGKSPMLAISDVAAHLMDEVLRLRENIDHEKFRPIAFITHDIGGLIVKEAVRLAVLGGLGEKYLGFLAATRCLINFGCPHRSSREASIADQMMALLMSNKKDSKLWINMKQLKALSDEIERLNDNFLSFEPSLALDIINIYSTHSTNQVFVQSTATLGLSHETVFSSPKPHRELCQLTCDDEIYKQITSRLSDTDNSFRLNVKETEWLHTLCTLAHPLYPSHWQPGDQNPLSWASEHADIQEWLKLPGQNLLYMHGKSITTLPAEYLAYIVTQKNRAFKPGTDQLATFTFQKNDIRFKTPTDMLGSLICQLVSRDPELYPPIKLMMGRMRHFHSWFEKELMVCFRDVIIQMPRRVIWCVIGNAGDCEGFLVPLIQELIATSRANECVIKIAFVGKTDSQIVDAFSGWPVVSLDDPSLTTVVVPTETTARATESSPQEPVLQEENITGPETVRCPHPLNRNHLIRHSKPAQLVITDFMHDTTDIDFAAIRDKTINTLERIDEKHHTYARDVLCWVLYAFRPLTVQELRAGLDNVPSSVTGVDSDFLRRKISSIFQGLLVVRHQEIHWVHPVVLDTIMDAQEGTGKSWYDVKDKAHGIILTACIKTLTSAGSLDYMELLRNSPLRTQACQFLDCVNNLVLYAAVFWSKHFQSTPVDSEARKNAKQFLSNITYVRRSCDMSWELSNPITRSDKSFLSILPYLASLGLKDVIEEYLANPVLADVGTSDRALAVCEAARNGHLELLREQLNSLPFSEAQMQDIALAGVFSASKEVLEMIVTHIIKHFESFVWPPEVLVRATSLCANQLVVTLLDAGAPVDASLRQIEGRPNLNSMYFAFREGNIDIFRTLVERNASLTQRYIWDRELLHVASTYGYVDMLKALLATGANVNTVDEDGFTPLYLSARWGFSPIVQILAETPGCEIGNDREGKWSPLTAAVDEGFYECARILLEHGADPNLMGPDDKTPLHYAILNEEYDICRLLIEKGAKVHDPVTKYAPLSQAGFKGRLDIVKLLVEAGHPVDAAETGGDTALTNAAGSGHVEVIEYLLSHGADVNQKSPDEWTALHLAYRHPKASKVLLEHGADVNAISYSQTPLKLAADCKLANTVKVILEYHPDLEVELDSERGQGYTALGLAVRRGSIEVTRLLLEAGANVNHQATSGTSAIHDAVVQDIPEMIQLLMEYRPNLHSVDGDGDTPLLCMALTASVENMKLLVNAGADLEARGNTKETALCRAAWYDIQPVVKYLLSRKAQIDIVGGKNGGPLHVACWGSSMEMVKTLIDAGADINLVDPFRGAPLQRAFYRGRYNEQAELYQSICRLLIGNPKIDINKIGSIQGPAINTAIAWAPAALLKLLLDKGARIDQPDAQGRLAIHLAAMRGLDHFEPVLNAGGDIDATDNVGRTVLHWAMLSGSVALIERVLSLSRRLTDVPDKDGWTPLLWVIRACHESVRPATPSVQQEIITMLIDRGADPCTHIHILGQDWSIVKLARYHNTADSVIRLLEMKYKDRLATQNRLDSWNEQFHQSRVAREKPYFCDGCFLDVYGFHHRCQICWEFDFCYKCYQTRDLTHPDHPFDSSSSDDEFVEVPEEDRVSKTGSTSTGSTNNSDEDDSDSESDDGASS